MSDERPVNLADVLGEITRANECGDINDGPFVELEKALRALPTMAPTDNPTEARRRMTGEWGGPDAYQGGYTLHYPAAPSDKPTDGHEPCGPWRLVTAVSVTDPGYHPSDPHQATMFVFERPLRRVPRG